MPKYVQKAYSHAHKTYKLPKINVCAHNKNRLSIMNGATSFGKIYARPYTHRNTFILKNCACIARLMCNFSALSHCIFAYYNVACLADAHWAYEFFASKVWMFLGTVMSLENLINYHDYTYKIQKWAVLGIHILIISN